MQLLAHKIKYKHIHWSNVHLQNAARFESFDKIIWKKWQYSEHSGKIHGKTNILHPPPPSSKKEIRVWIVDSQRASNIVQDISMPNDKNSNIWMAHNGLNVL